jgi:hypothetical protein
MNYTKGDWRVPESPYARVITENGIGIANCYDNDFINRPKFWQAEVNAQLIAAAPDMYKALKLLLERFEEMRGKYSYPMSLDLPRVWAEKALAKTEGK